MTVVVLGSTNDCVVLTHLDDIFLW